MTHKFLALLLIAFLAACAGPQTLPVEHRVKIPDVLPEKLNGEGLLVATIAASNMARSGVEAYSFNNAGVQIDNTLYDNAVHDGYLVLPLKPGEYTLSSLHVFGKAEDNRRTRYPLNYRFRITENQANNLGIIVLLKDTRPDAKSTSYLKNLVDNTSDMSAYLRKHYPKLGVEVVTQLASSASGRTTRFVNPQNLEYLRRQIAQRQWLVSDDAFITTHVGGEVGTMAKLLRNTRGKVVAIDVIDSKTTYALRSCSGHDNRFVCSSPEPALYHLNDTTVTRRVLPFPARHVWVHTFPPQGLVLVDQNQMVYMSSDNGLSWKKQVWFDRKKPLEPQHNIKFTNGKNGYYVYATFSFDPLVSEVVYSDYGHKGLQRIDIPKMKRWERLLELSQGIVVGPVSTDNTEPSRIYFRAHGQTAWQARPLPGPQCSALQRESTSGDNIVVYCSSKFYSSADAGQSWTDFDPAKK